MSTVHLHYTWRYKVICLQLQPWNWLQGCCKIISFIFLFNLRDSRASWQIGNIQQIHSIRLQKLKLIRHVIVSCVSTAAVHHQAASPLFVSWCCVFTSSSLFIDVENLRSSNTRTRLLAWPGSESGSNSESIFESRFWLGLRPGLGSDSGPNAQCYVLLSLYNTRNSCKYF